MPGYGADAPDISADDIVPRQRLRDSGDCLHDRAELDRRYVEDGYLFFRGMIDKDAIAQARHNLLAPLVARGLAEARGDGAVWVGGDAASLPDDSPEFAGVCEALFATPGVLGRFDALLGEEVSLIPNINYRAYPPVSPKRPSAGGVHQDGFYSPGVAGFRPLWVALTPMDEKVGGLALAQGMTGRGFFHNTDKTPRCTIPAGVIPHETWSWTAYEPGDVVVLHPETPHAGLPNRSDRMRLSLDVRVQARANPSAIAGTLEDWSADHVSLRQDDGALIRLTVDDATFIRIEDPGRRTSRPDFAAATQAGVRVLASMEGGRALMLRRAVA